MSTPEEDPIISRWLAGDISDEEFANTRSKEELLKYQQILGEVDQWIPENHEMALVLPESKKKGRVLKLAKWSAISVAASVVLVAFFSILFLKKSDEINHRSAFGETKEINLPDGSSKVILAANSAISWRGSDWNKDERNIKLKGKAYFDIEPGSTFHVITKNGVVEVLGTTFDVNTYETALQVICYTGSVRAQTNDNISRIVASGESVRYFDGQWEEKTMIADTKPTWVSSELRFSNAPLSEVLASLSSEYALTFDTQAINQKRRFSGFLPKDDIEASLNILFATLGISYERKETNVLLIN